MGRRGHLPHRSRAAVLVAAAVAVVAGCTEVSPSQPDDAPTASASDTSSPPGSPPASAPLTAEAPRVEVVDVIDGDTLDVRVDGTVERIRLIGINTPERGECFADEARDALVDLVAGREVRLERDTSGRDQYGRVLAYLHVDGEHVNAALVRGGFAIARSYPPDTSRDDELAAAQREAQRTGAGLWGADGCASDVDAEPISLSVEADAPGDDSTNLNGEWLEIRNTGDEPLDLSGWTVKDESATHRYTFTDGTRVPGGASLRLFTGCGDDTAAERYWCRTGSAVWNNDGDTAFLLDPDGRTVTSHAY